MRGTEQTKDDEVKEYSYDVYGQAYQGKLNDSMPFGYTGKPLDLATGLYDYGFRDYQPGTGRFTTVDPIKDGSNWYAYCGNDPVNYQDPTGLQMAGPIPNTATPRADLESDPSATNVHIYNCHAFAWNSDVLEWIRGEVPKVTISPDLDDPANSENVDTPLWDNSPYDEITSGKYTEVTEDPIKKVGDRLIYFWCFGLSCG